MQRSAKLLDLEIEEDAAKRLAQSCRRTPRIANRLLRRVRDYAHVHHPKHAVGTDTVEATLKLLGIDQLGLDSTDRKILDVMMNQFEGGPVGLSTLSAASNEESATIEDIYEPFLLQLGFMKRTPRGRLLTKKVYNHLGLSPKV